eukprot:4948254-Amphidinium_carterae.1
MRTKAGALVPLEGFEQCCWHAEAQVVVIAESLRVQGSCVLPKLYACAAWRSALQCGWMAPKGLRSRARPSRYWSLRTKSCLREMLDVLLMSATKS